jgi:hypothetical protein
MVLWADGGEPVVKRLQRIPEKPPLRYATAACPGIYPASVLFPAVFLAQLPALLRGHVPILLLFASDGVALPGGKFEVAAGALAQLVLLTR